MFEDQLSFQTAQANIGRFCLGGGDAFQSKMDKAYIVQQNMDDRICVSCSCFGLHAFLPSVYIFEKANESIHLSRTTVPDSYWLNI